LEELVIFFIIILDEVLLHVAVELIVDDRVDIEDDDDDDDEEESWDPTAPITLAFHSLWQLFSFANGNGSLSVDFERLCNESIKTLFVMIFSIRLFKSCASELSVAFAFSFDLFSCKKTDCSFEYNCSLYFVLVGEVLSVIVFADNLTIFPLLAPGAFLLNEAKPTDLLFLGRMNIDLSVVLILLRRDMSAPLLLLVS
jgi:hypothetical protein